jgi:hypothetical protein
MKSPWEFVMYSPGHLSFSGPNVNLPGSDVIVYTIQM